MLGTDNPTKLTIDEVKGLVQLAGTTGTDFELSETDLNGRRALVVGMRKSDGSYQVFLYIPKRGDETNSPLIDITQASETPA